MILQHDIQIRAGARAPVVGILLTLEEGSSVADYAAGKRDWELVFRTSRASTVIVLDASDRLQLVDPRYGRVQFVLTPAQSASLVPDGSSSASGVYDISVDERVVCEGKWHAQKRVTT